MVAEPIPAPVTCGCVAGVVAPFRMTTLDGTVTLFVSLLVRVTVTSADAGCDKLTANVADSPNPTVAVAGILIVGSGETVTMAVALAMPAALAVMVAAPCATPVAGTFTLVAPAAKLTAGGTVALLVSLELRLRVTPPPGP